MWHIQESYLPYYRKATALPDLSGKRSYLRSSGPFLPVITKSYPPPPTPGTIMETTCKTDLPAYFSQSSTISESWYSLQKWVKGVSFGFCFRPQDPNKMTHITVPRAKCLQKCGLPENTKLVYQVWDLSCVPSCSGIVWFHRLSPTLPNFYQTRQEAGTLYSVCTVALSKTSLFSFFANVSGKGINMLCAKWITAN